MPLILKHRRTDLTELMDRHDVDLERLFRTYDGFRVINPLLARWRPIYRSHIKPVLARDPQKVHTLLDIGCGGGDVMESLSRYAAKDGFKLSVTGIDPDVNAEAYLRLRNPNVHIHFRKASSSQLVMERLKFDFVISNHVMHHLDDVSLTSLANDANALTRNMVLFNDIERSDLAWLVFNMTWPFFWRSFITPDGLMSIRRSFIKSELSKLLGDGWEVRRIFPYRLLLIGRQHMKEV
jgi:2-polyprenyl-3-methyl-5-hydroxy-6-metoxy-1,4-benzoquinol methylase